MEHPFDKFGSAVKVERESPDAVQARLSNTQNAGVRSALV